MVEIPRFLILVFVLITDSQSVLLVRDDPLEEDWGLPGGIVQYGLRVDEAAVDYVREQCGIDVELSRILAIYTYDYDEVLAIVFRGEAGAAGAHVDDSRGNAPRYFHPEDLPAMASEQAGYVRDLIERTGGPHFEARR